MAIIDDFTCEVECIYKDERYAVRDNGASAIRVMESVRANTTTSGHSGNPISYMAIWKSHLSESMPLSQLHSSAPSPPKNTLLIISTRIVGITGWRISVGLRGWKIYSTTPLRGKESYCAAAVSKHFWRILLYCRKMNCRPISNG